MLYYIYQDNHIFMDKDPEIRKDTGVLQVVGSLANRTIIADAISCLTVCCTVSSVTLSTPVHSDRNVLKQ